MNLATIQDDHVQAGPPRVLLLGPVEVQGAIDPLVEPTRRNRLTELAAILATHPGCDHATIDACYYPGQRVGDNARNTQISKLRRWLGRDPQGEDYLPRYFPGSQYRLHAAVRSDWDEWQELLGDGPGPASSEQLEQALALVRGRPFDGVRPRRYAWADLLKQQMTDAIVEAAHELARRRLWEGDWQSAEHSIVLGLSLEPGLERLWRLRILTAHASGNQPLVQEAADRLLVILSDLDTAPEPATAELLTDLASRKVIHLRPRRH